MRTDYSKKGCLFPYKLYPKHSGKREISLRNELSSNRNLTAHRGLLVVFTDYYHLSKQGCYKQKRITTIKQNKSTNKLWKSI